MGLIVAIGLLLCAILAYSAFALSPRRWMGWLSTSIAVLSGLAWIALLVERGLRARQWPLGTTYEFGLVAVWLMVSAYLILEFSWRERRAAPIVLGIAMLLALRVLAIPVEDRTVSQLSTALRSLWLQGHVLALLLGQSASGVGAGLGICRLIRGRIGDTPAETAARTWLPPIDEIDYMLERVLSLAFPWLCLGVLSGAIWAQNALGRYWGWDPKETWSLIVLLWYLATIHLRPYRRWRGRAMAWLAIIGFAVVLFSLIGLGTLASGV